MTGPLTIPLPITASVGGVTLEGEIVYLAPNDIKVRLTAPATSPAVGTTRGLHVPHFMVAYPQNRLATPDGALTPRGRAKAEALLIELYTAAQSPAAARPD